MKMFKNRNFMLYVLGRLVSLLGSSIQMMVLPLYILDMTGSGALMGVFSALSIVPSMITAPFAGIIGDRKNRKHIMVFMDYARGAVICLLGLFVVFDIMNIWILFSVQVFISIMDSIFNGSTSAFLPELVEEANLMEANSMKSSVDSVAFIAGPILGGLIYGVFGIKFVFFFNGISFILSGISEMFIKYSPKIKEKGKFTSMTFISDLKEVISFIGKSKGLIQLFTFAMISNFLLAPLFNIIMPFVLKKEIGFSSQYYGIIMAFFMVGILIGNLAIASHFKKFGSKKIMKSGLIIETVVTAIICLIMLPSFAEKLGGAGIILFSVMITGCVGMGFFNAFVNTPISTNLQLMVSNDMRSRFFSILGVISQGAIPIGSLLYGVLLDKLPYAYLLIGVNAASILSVVIFLIRACNEVYEPKSISVEQ